MNKKVSVSILIILVCFGIYWFFGDNVEIKNYPPHEGNVVAFGDSLVSGNGSTPGNDFVSLLSVKINEPIINLGISGNTTRDGLARIDEIFDKNPRIVLLLLGGNDYLKRIPSEETFKNLREIISRLEEKGILVVLLGIRGGVLVDHFDADFEDLARENGTAYVPDVLDGIFGKNNLMSDTIHPNDEGYKIIADRVFTVVSKVLR